MSYSSHSSPSSSSQSLTSHSSRDRPQRVSGGDDSEYEVVELELDNIALTQSAPKHVATPVTYLPSVEDLNRMDRWMALQERMANLNSILRQGHTYGKLTVAGNARAIRGNIYKDSASLPCLRNHTYGESDAKEDGMIWEGDISMAAFNDPKRQGTSSR